MAGEAGETSGELEAGTRRVVHILHPQDNVGTALRDLEAGESVTYDRDGAPVTLEVRQPIAFGHKLALERIGAGEPVRKYGEAIGLASQEIGPGEHVHVHNVESQRGRGDLARPKSDV